jgi:hypothetical protein
MGFLSNLESANAVCRSGQSAFHKDIDEDCSEGYVVQDDGSTHKVQSRKRIEGIVASSESMIPGEKNDRNQSMSKPNAQRNSGAEPGAFC